MFVDIVDIGSGNIKSIQNWIERVNIPTRIVTNVKDIKSKFMVLPGVGSAGPYMKRLKKGDFDKAILEHVNDGNRILGICLGFQLMGEFSKEDGGVEGIGLIKGSVEKLKNTHTHNGWEKFHLMKEDLGESSFSSELKLTRKRIINGRVFYNHEYGFVLDEECTYNKIISDKYSDYSSLIVKNNVIGMQFHPEKSQETGIDLISMIL